MLYNTKLAKLSYQVIKWRSRATRMLQSQITRGKREGGRSIYLVGNLLFWLPFLFRLLG
jgi:hypothetical protein